MEQLQHQVAMQSASPEVRNAYNKRQIDIAIQKAKIEELGLKCRTLEMKIKHQKLVNSTTAVDALHDGFDNFLVSVQLISYVSLYMYTSIL